jgi:2'-5' RNA ligase
MRLFLAVPLSEEIRAALTEVQGRLKAANADVRWVTPESFHLTVAFIGDVDDSLLAPIEEACAGVAADAAAFRVRIRGGSAFPKRGPVLKTLWVGVPEGAEEWKALARRAEEALRVFGVARGNELVPHITLGRVKGERNMDALRGAVSAEAETECGAQTADRMTLVQSFLNPSGAVYKDVRTWNLGSSN